MYVLYFIVTPHVAQFAEIEAGVEAGTLERLSIGETVLLCRQIVEATAQVRLMGHGSV